MCAVYAAKICDCRLTASPPPPTHTHFLRLYNIVGQSNVMLMTGANLIGGATSAPGTLTVILVLRGVLRARKQAGAQCAL